MGYDMRWQKGSQDEGYFGCNIWGMGKLRVAMDIAELFSDLDENEEFPDFPKDWTDEDRQAYHDDKPNEKVQAFMKEREAFLSRRSKKEGCVPWFKFSSNDFWIVTADECLLIATKLDALLHKAEVEKVELTVHKFDSTETFELKKGDRSYTFIKEFADYNRLCAENNTGYEVF